MWHRDIRLIREIPRQRMAETYEQNKNRQQALHLQKGKTSFLKIPEQMMAQGYTHMTTHQK